MEEAKGLLNIQDYEGAEKVLAGIKFSSLPEEFKFVGDIFLACSYAQQNKMAQLKSLVAIMKNNAIFYQEKPEFKELFGHLCKVCEQFDLQKVENSQFSDLINKLEADPTNLDLKYEAASTFK